MQFAAADHMPAMEKKELEVEAYFERLKPPIEDIARWLRQLVKKTAPDLREGLKWLNPTYTGKGNVIYIGALDRYVQFGFYKGAHLKNPKGLLEGTGKGLRHMKVYKVDKAQEASLRDLVLEAVALDRA